MRVHYYITLAGKLVITWEYLHETKSKHLRSSPMGLTWQVSKGTVTGGLVSSECRMKRTLSRTSHLLFCHTFRIFPVILTLDNNNSIFISNFPAIIIIKGMEWVRGLGSPSSVFSPTKTQNAEREEIVKSPLMNLKCLVLATLMT